ncbi:MAG: hypothetical protein ACYC3X_28835 [Pirellulaceae bacterium]
MRTGQIASPIKTKTGADDNRRPEFGGNTGRAQNQQSSNPGNPDNDLRHGSTSGGGGAEVPGWTDQVWWYLWETRAQPPK